jgi:putative ATP-binding cassette transporter
VIIQAPRFFSQQITLGDVTQTAQAFGQVEGSLSFFRLAYDDFASYKASLNRLTQLLDANEEARALPVRDTEERSDGLGVRDLDVRLPNGRPLLTDLDLDLRGGESLLVKGPSGSGKTTLLRSLAGLWPYVDGTIDRPMDGQAMFCGQQPYLPLGSLRTALAYPSLPRPSATTWLQTYCGRSSWATWQTDWMSRPTGPRRCLLASNNGWPSDAS